MEKHMTIEDTCVKNMMKEYKIKCLTLNEHDTLVLKSSKPISDKESALMQNKLHEVFGDVPILVMDNRLDFFVIKNNTDDANNEVNVMDII